MWFETKFLLLLLALQIISSKCFILPTPNDFSTGNTLNWSQAESYCSSKYGSHLASIHNPNSLIEIITEIINLNQHGNYFWVGVSSNYEWSDGTSFDFFSTLLHKTNITNFKYITLKTTITKNKNKNNNNTLFVNTNGTKKHFWICNDTPIQSTLFATLSPSNNNNQSPIIINNLIFIIIGIFFGICCTILICSIIILKTCKYKILWQAKQQDLATIKSKSKSNSNSHNIKLDDRASVDEGIIDKLQRIKEHNRRQKSKSSMNLTIDMSTGHIVLNIEPLQQPIENININNKKKKTYRKRKHKNNLNINNNENENIKLGPNEFIIESNSIEQTKGVLTIYDDHALPDYYQRKITDFYENENENENSIIIKNEKEENLKYKDEDGYFIDVDEKIDVNECLNDGIQNDIVNSLKEGYSKKRILKNIFKTNETNNRNDSDEEYYKEPSFNRKFTDGELV